MKKFSIILTLSILIAIMSFGNAAAWYTGISGEVRDSKTQALWTNGATINIWDCSDIDGTAVATGTVAGDGTFSIAFDEAAANRFLCVEFNFGDGTNGTPDDKWELVYDDGTNGTFDLGTIYTDTGPTAVTLTNISATSNNLPIIAAVFVILGSISLVILRRRTTGTIIHTEK